MPKKEIVKPQEKEERETSGLIETRIISATPQLQQDIQRYIDFRVEKELEPIKKELGPLLQELSTLVDNVRSFALGAKDLQLVTQKLKEELGVSALMKLDNIVTLYNQGNLSLGRAAELANLKYDQMIEELRKRGVKLKFGPETLGEAIEEERTFRETMKRS